ncbi:unnamed protein product [Amaranthus hypochondriacus]
MKSSKRAKENGEQPSIQGSINKSPIGIGGKKSRKNSGGQQQKRAGAVGKDLKSIVHGTLPQNNDCNLDERSSINTEKEKKLRSLKMILQLFPIDEKTRMGLEKVGHNPFLELTLSPRKKISSVLTHIHNKWGSSSGAAIDELKLFPFNIAAHNLNSCLTWNLSDIGVTAGDVHAALGSPGIFRLRYGWVSLQPNNSPLNPISHAMEGSGNTMNDVEGTSKELGPCNENESTDMAVEQRVLAGPLLYEVHKEPNEVKSKDLKLNMSSTVESDTAAEENASAAPYNSEELRVDAGSSMTSLLWSDLSNISFGGLLSEASLQAMFKTEEQISGGNRLISHPNMTDSIDAMIEKLKQPQSLTTISPEMPPSILDAESTCHSFAFSKLSTSKDSLTPGKGAFSGLSDSFQSAVPESFKCPKSEGDAQESAFGSINVREPKMDLLPCSSGIYNNDNSRGLSSLRWNDSVGPFDLPLISRQLIKDDSVSIGGFVR